jgi:hypothetical protein
MNALTPFGEQQMMSKAWRGQLLYMLLLDCLLFDWLAIRA